ncbi:MAG: putative DNA binding domain-containing protein [Desulfosarcina sp.]|nr:putative DNA binding domain-containing protein [Desulfosarcina sp.]MBC2744940.1 putative DNA binding domain-containing protein [Desulfosarcina sp.]MBC2767848.1 winged helix-turn-helix transcriptional regulator [Desulfosarcina sp.]
MKQDELIEIITNGENSGIEFKLDDIRPEQLAKEVVALANLKGGHILLGVADDKTITGITRSNLSEWVADTVFGRYVHPQILPYYQEVVMSGGKRVAVITIGQEVLKPYVVRANDRETAYVRIGNVTRPATREQILMLGAASGAVHTEIMPVNRTSIASLDQARLENYLRDILRDPEVPGEKEGWITRLKALGFMTDGVADDPVCTIAGLVLFGIRPRQTLKQSGIRLMFFDSNDKTYQAQLDRFIDAPMVGRFQVGKTGKSLIDAGLIEKTLEAMEPFVTLEPNTIDENFRREKIWFYPYEALRELLINALVHRDWSRFVDVEIAGYRDRLEIISPGALPNSMTVEKMLAGQRSARNHIIVEVLRDYGYVDARGMGVRTKVIPALKVDDAHSLFDATDDYMKVVVGKASGKTGEITAKVSVKTTRSVGKTSGKILSAISDNANITIPEVADLVGVTQRSVERNLRKLQQEGVLKRVGGRKHGYWEVTER